MKKIIISIFVLAGLIALGCGGGATTDSAGESSGPPSYLDQKQQEGAEEPPAESDINKGIGEVKEVSLNDPLKADMVERGKAIYEMKCAACHKLTDQRVVGPGWKGLTEKREPEWIMNMITNVEVMLAEDPTAQALLEECLVRMPNQNLSVGDARDVLEFIYANDGYEVAEQ